MGITRIIIAHRRETIEIAKRVLVMDGGKLHDLQDILIQQQLSQNLERNSGEQSKMFGPGV